MTLNQVDGKHFSAIAASSRLVIWNWPNFSGEILFMTKVHIIEKEVKSLNKRELAEFRDWFLEFDFEAWDAQVEQDAHSGKLDRLAQEALEQHERGESKAL